MGLLLSVWCLGRAGRRALSLGTAGSKRFPEAAQGVMQHVAWEGFSTELMFAAGEREFLREGFGECWGYMGGNNLIFLCTREAAFTNWSVTVFPSPIPGRVSQSPLLWGAGLGTEQARNLVTPW